MDAAELDRRARTYDGWIPPELVSELVELGHLDEVWLQAHNGDWYCAYAWAQTLIEQGRREAALEVLAPFVDAGWWGAAEKVAHILDGWGRTDEAIALVRPHAEAGEHLALADLAKLLARHGRKNEAFELLRPHTKNRFLVRVLVEVTAGLGRDEDVAGLLEAHIEFVRQQEWWRRDPSDAVELLALVRERQGRVDEAVALLHTRDVRLVNCRDQLAELLARHHRLDELRDYIAGEGSEEAASPLVELLEECGDLEGAVAVLQPLVAGGSAKAAVTLAEVLSRNDRVDEAIEVLRPVSPSMDHDREWVVRKLWTLLADQGRAEEALTFIDDLAAQVGGMWWELFCERVWLLSYCGHGEQAITELRARPEVDTWSGALYLCDLLADAGRLDEAIAFLQSTSVAEDHRNTLAKLLIRRGRVKDAITILHQRRPDFPPSQAPLSLASKDEPPF